MGVETPIIDDGVDAEIASYLAAGTPRSFFLYAGAGSGKTRALVSALKYIQGQHGKRLKLNGQRVAVITYTNAASDEIKRRIEHDPLFQVSTIHSFAWELIGGYNTDIKEWLRKNIAEDIRNIEAEEAKGRVGTKASIARQAQIESKRKRLAMLDQIKKFNYNPSGDNRERDSLNHSEVIEISAALLTNKPLLRRILVNRNPFLFIDESQDTNKLLIDAFFVVETEHRDRFCIGFFGDMMQRIYTDGKEDIERYLPNTWGKPTKNYNHRCPKRIVRLINRIRSDVDDHVQVPREDSIEGIVRLFIFPADATNKPEIEERIRTYMANETGDNDWKDRSKCKILALEHHMAAKRMGFESVFESLSKIGEFRTGLLDGSLPEIRFFTDNILPIVKANKAGDKFQVARIVRNSSPLLSRKALKESADQRAELGKANSAVHKLVSLWSNGEPSCRAILRNVAESGLFDIPSSLKASVALTAVNASEPEEKDDKLSEMLIAIEEFLTAPFSQIEPYANYIAGQAPFDTHQGVKGLEFERVMVLMDDSEARGFLFAYDKLFGAKAPTATDLKNEKEGKETSIDRTRRLFYVTCSRAKKSLALVAYTSVPEAVKKYVKENNWFEEKEIISTF